MNSLSNIELFSYKMTKVCSEDAKVVNIESKGQIL